MLGILDGDTELSLEQFSSDPRDEFRLELITLERFDEVLALDLEFGHN
jgi:hypothetical protein